jgi:broad specificity phosphatase PhoE
MVVLANTTDLLDQSQNGSRFMTSIILVRHGQTEWNRVERFRGHADVPLDETGLAQAEATGICIARRWKPTAVYSSPLSRAMKTAEAIAKGFSLPVQAHPDLIDINYGKWQGLTPDEVREHWPAALHAWYNNPIEARIPEGETLADLRLRAMRTVNELAGKHNRQTIVLVGHTVINRIILLGVLGLTNERFWHIKQDTCAINVFEAENHDFVLVSLNDTCHLYDQ